MRPTNPQGQRIGGGARCRCRDTLRRRIARVAPGIHFFEACLGTKTWRNVARLNPKQQFFLRRRSQWNRLRHSRGVKDFCKTLSRHPAKVPGSLDVHQRLQKLAMSLAVA